MDHKETASEKKETASEKKPLKSRFRFRLIGTETRPETPYRVEYLFDEKILCREDWVALQNHLLLKSLRGSDNDSGPSKSIFEMIFGK